MNKQSQRWLGLLIVVLTLSVTACSSLGFAGQEQQTNETNSSSLAVGAAVPTVTPGPVPTRTLTTLYGEEITLAKWHGKGVILNFWATWCYPCRQEMPALAAIHQAHEDIIVVGVNYLEDADTARGFVSEFELPFPIIIDQKGWLVGDLGVKGLPTTFFINADGQLVGSHIGPLDEEALEEIVAQIGPP